MIEGVGDCCGSELNGQSREKRNVYKAEYTLRDKVSNSTLIQALGRCV
jgi:hypothetical protein